MREKKEKVVGIVGGMGPFATLHFFQSILTLTPAKKDNEHLRILIDNNVKIPSRTRAILYNEEKPTKYIIDSINNLARIGADFAVIPCNSAHFFYDDVAPHISIPWLHIIDVVKKRIHAKNPLILGGYIVTREKLYSNFFKEAVYLNDEENNFIYRIIEEIKITACLSKNHKERLYNLLATYKTSCDAIFLSCTELPIVIEDPVIHEIPVVNVNMLYAKATITYAKSSTF